MIINDDLVTGNIDIIASWDDIMFAHNMRMLFPSSNEQISTNSESARLRHLTKKLAARVSNVTD